MKTYQPRTQEKPHIKKVKICKLEQKEKPIYTVKGSE